MLGSSSVMAFAFLVAALIPSVIIASPLEEIAAVGYHQQRDVDATSLIQERAAVIQSGQTCRNPAQINLDGDPGINNLGACGWKMWAACTGLAVGACVIPCAEGGYVVPHLNHSRHTDWHSELTYHHKQPR